MIRTGARVRIGVAFTVLALLVFGAIVMLSAREAHRQSERDTAAVLQQVADRLAQRLDADMAARFRDVQQLASIEGLLEQDLSPQRWRTLLERLQASMKHYSWIGLALPDGTVLASTQGLLEGRNVRQRPWFAKGLARAAVDDVHEAALLAALLPGTGTGEPLRFVDVAAPLQRDGETLGVIGAHLSWSWAEERRREALAMTGDERRLEIVLVDRGGSIALGPSQPAMPAGTASGPAGIIEWSNGESYLTAARPSQPMGDYPGMGWTVVVRQPASTAFAAADALRYRLWTFGLLGALVFGLVGWWLAGRLTEPLRQVARRAQAMMPEGTSLISHDEVDQLGASLSALLDDLKQREQALQSLNETLETRVRERTASLLQANEDLRSFTRSVSHDLRGPLGSMAMVLRQVLTRKDQQLGDSARRTIEIAATECERLYQLAEELLTLALVEQRAFEMAPIDTTRLVEEALHEVRSAAPGWNPEVTVQALPGVTGDAVMLRQVWSNLLSNAFKYSSKVAQARVEVSAQARDTETEFTVSDNGAGFDPSQAARLFGVFERLHASSAFPGTGVGLSIVRRVVHRHGGRVWAESTPGQGARFHFVLPKTPPDQRDLGSAPPG